MPTSRPSTKDIDALIKELGGTVVDRPQAGTSTNVDDLIAELGGEVVSLSPFEARGRTPETITAPGPRRFVADPRGLEDPLTGMLPGDPGYAERVGLDLAAERDARRRALPDRRIPNPLASSAPAFTADEMTQARRNLAEVDAAQGENYSNPTVDRFLADTSIDVMKGAASLPGAAVRLADIVGAIPGFQPGRALARRGIDLNAVSNTLEQAQSPELRAAKEAADQESQGDGFFSTMGKSIKATAKRPSVALSMAAESLPGMFGGAGLGRAVLGSTLGGALLGEAAITSAGVADTFAQKDPEAGLTRAQAGYAVLAGGIGMVISKFGNTIANTLGFDDVDTMLVGAANNPAVRHNLATRVIYAGIQEGLFEEAPQSAVEQIMTNAGLGQPLLKGVGQSAGQGAVVGGVMGMGAQGVAAPEHAEQRRKAEAEAKLAQEWEAGRPERSAAFAAANEAYAAQFTPERAQAIRDARYAETHPTPEGVRANDPNYGGDPIERMPPPLRQAPPPETNAAPAEAQAPPAPEAPGEAPAAEDDLPPLDLEGMTDEDLIAALGGEEVPTPPADQPAPAPTAEDDLPPLNLEGLSDEDLMGALGEQPAAPEPAAPPAETPAPEGPRTVDAIDADIAAHWTEKPKSLLKTFGKMPTPEQKQTYNSRVKTWRDRMSELKAERREVRASEEGQAQRDYIAQYPDDAADMAEPAEDLPRNWRERVRAARANGFTGSVDQLAQAHRDLTSLRKATAEADNDSGDRAFMQAIADAGGLRWDAEAPEAGELQMLWESSPEYVTQGRKKDGRGFLASKRMPRGSLYGVPGVLRNDGTGLTLDGMREALSPDNGGAFGADTADLNAFLDRLTNAAHQYAIGNVGEDATDWSRPWWREVVNDDGSSANGLAQPAQGWSWRAVRSTFGYNDDVAKAVDAIARSIFTAKELANILLQKGGTPGEGARVQRPGAASFVERERMKRAKRRALPQRGPEAEDDFSFGDNQWATARGSMELLEGAGQALIRALNEPNASTAPHELIHVARVFLLNREMPAEMRQGITDAMIDAVEAEYGVEGEWTEDQEEAFARDFERYLQRGQAPSAALKGVFEKFATWMRDIYDTLLGNELSPEMISVFDQLLTRTDRLNAPKDTGKRTDVALPGLEKVRGEALGSTGPRIAKVSAQAPDDGTFRLDAERADGRTLTEREQLEEAGQGSMLGGQDLGLSDAQREAADKLKAMLKQRQPLQQRAWHGTGHTFDQFSLHEIGNGEGSQAFGWGLYFTSTRHIAEFYRKLVGRRMYPNLSDLKEYFAPGSLVPSYGSVWPDRVISFNEGEGGRWSVTVEEVREKDGKWVAVEKPRTHATPPEDFTFERVMGREPRRGKTYEVEIPEDDDFLLWDRPLSEQSDKVKAAITEYARNPSKERIDDWASNVSYTWHHRLSVEDSKKLLALHDAKTSEAARAWLDDGGRDLLQKYGGMPEDFYDGLTGEQFYKALTRERRIYDPEGAKRASERLASLGIAGIKYLDRQSRAKGEGTYNFVVFDDNLVKIMEKHEPEAPPTQRRVLFQNDDPMVKLAVTFIREGAKKGQNLHQVWADFAAYMGEGYQDAKPVFERAGQFLYKRPVTLKANPLEAKAPAPAPKPEPKAGPPASKPPGSAPPAPKPESKAAPTHEAMGEQVAGFGKYPTIKLKALLSHDRGYVAYLLDQDPDRMMSQRAKDVRDWLREDDAVKAAFGAEFIAGVNQTTITADQQQALDQAGLTGEVFTLTQGDRRKLMVRLSGGAGAIDAWKSLIAEIGGRRITPGRDWQLNLRGQFAAFVARLRGAASTGVRPSNRRAAYLSDPQLRQLREDLEREDDRSGLDRDPLVRLDPATIAAIRKGEGRVPPDVLTEQLEDIARIAQAHERKTGFYLLASDPGSGKTFVLGGAIQELKRQGAKQIVYVTMGENLIAQIRRDLAAFDLSGVEFVSYTQLRKRAEGEVTDVLIFDESHNAKNDEGAQQGIAAKAWIDKSAFTVFTSATPVENPVEMKYYEPTNLFADAGGYLNWVVAFGASPVRNPDGTIRSAAWINTSTSEDDAKAARTWLVKRGVYTSRPIRLPKDQVNTRLVPVPSDPPTRKLYDDILNAANTVPSMSMNGRMWLKNFQKRITEASKVPLAIVRAQNARDAGRFPVIFVETKAERTLDIKDILQKEDDYQSAYDEWKRMPRDMRPPKPQRGQFGAKPEGIAKMLDAYMARTGEAMIVIPSAEDVIAEHFGADKVAIYTGSVSNTEAQQNLAAWRAGAKPVLVATMAKGGTGLSLHDTTGKHPTTQIVVTLPWTATSVVQVAQRTARYGMLGTAEIEWLFAEDIDFDKALAARVGTRMANMGATVHGKVSGDAAKIQAWELDQDAAAKYTRRDESDDSETADSVSDTPRSSTPRSTRASQVTTTERPAASRPLSSATPPAGMRDRAPDITAVKGLELPELVELAQTLMKTPRLVKSFRKIGKMGEFSSQSGISILRTLASPENVGEVVKVLAHEIGHLIDWLPTQTLKRGNLLGRLYSLDTYLKHTIQGIQGDTVQLADVQRELTKVSDTWRPWDRGNASPEFTKYRNSSRELYADALSMLLNDPAQFKALAPTVWREFLDGLDRKPEVQEAYESLQTLLNGAPEDLAKHRLSRAEEMFEKGETRQYEIAKDRQALRERLTPSFVQKLKAHYLSRNYPAIDRVLKLRKAFKLELPDSVNPIYALEERTHLGSTQKAWVERYVDQVRVALDKAGVSWAHFGAQLFYERILFDEQRKKVGQPLGTTLSSAESTLAEMRRRYSPKQLEVLDAQMKKFRDGMKLIAEMGHDASLFSPEQWEVMKENTAYAPFRVLDYMEQSMKATVRQQHGTWKDIQNPADAAILKALVTISSAAHQQAKLKMVDMLDRYFSDEIQHAPRKFKDGRLQPVESDNPDLRMVTFLRDGQTYGVYLPPYTAEMLSRSSSIVSPLVEVLGQANAVWFRPVLTTFNVAFQAANLLRDMWRTWKNETGMSLAKLLKRYWGGRAIAIARASDGKLEKSKISRRLLGVSPQAFEQAVEQMLDAEERRILSVSFRRFMDMGDPELTQVDAILVKLGFMPPSTPKQSKVEQWMRLQALKASRGMRDLGMGPAVDAGTKLAGKTGRGLNRVVDGMLRAGDIIEALPKAAALVHEAERAGGIKKISPSRRSFIRRKAGSPDFLDLGMSGGAMNKVLLFSNAVLQAWRADSEVALEPKSRLDWWTKTIVFNVVPKIVMALALGGAFDDDDDDPQNNVSTWMRAVPYYDLLNYLVIPNPFDIDANGKVGYFRFPQDDVGRMVSGVLWDVMANAAGRRDDSLLEMASNFVKYTAGQFPGPSPAVTLPIDAFSALTGQNVLDTFRGKFVFTPDEMDAGGLPKAQKFLRYAYKDLGGDVFFKMSLEGRAEAGPDNAWDTITSIPIAGNLLGRFYRKSDAGLREMGWEAMTKERGVEAKTRIKELNARNVALDRLFKASADARPGMRWGLAREIVQQVYADRDANERGQRTAAIVKKLDMGVLRGDSDLLTELVLSAQTNRQKAAAIARVRTTMSDTMFRQWLKQARRVGVVSDDLDSMIPAR